MKSIDSIDSIDRLIHSAYVGLQWRQDMQNLCTSNFSIYDRQKWRRTAAVENSNASRAPQDGERSSLDLDGSSSRLALDFRMRPWAGMNERPKCALSTTTQSQPPLRTPVKSLAPARSLGLDLFRSRPSQTVLPESSLHMCRRSPSCLSARTGRRQHAANVTFLLPLFLDRLAPPAQCPPPQLAHPAPAPVERARPARRMGRPSNLTLRAGGWGGARERAFCHRLSSGGRPGRLVRPARNSP